MTVKYNDYPLEEIAAAAQEAMEQGADVYQKFTCAKCGSRQTMAQKNAFFIAGKCEECHHITDLRKQGCNYMAHYKLTEKARQGGNDNGETKH